MSNNNDDAFSDKPTRPISARRSEDAEDTPRRRTVKKSSSNLPLILMIAVPVVAVVILFTCVLTGVGAYFLFSPKPNDPVVVVAKDDAPQDKGIQKKKDPEANPKEPKPNNNAEFWRVALGAMKNNRFEQPPPSVAATNYLHLDSSAGDFIGQGKTYAYLNPQWTVAKDFRGVRVMVDGWMFNVSAAGKDPLVVGEYIGAKRFPFNGNSPGLSFSGKGRGANQLAGTFRVWEIEFEGNNVTRLAVDFVQRSEIAGPPLYGVLRHNSKFQ
ncbi:MAG: hypothetical protein HY289_05450 [Planctomycetes bacterium]|nr:hypothetical protein [Planctomycetota bacterium]